MLAFISTITVLLSIILIIYNYRLNKNAIFLALFFISFATYGFAHYAIVHGQNEFLLAIAYNHFTPIVLLAGPFLFFYVRGTLTDVNKISKVDLVHFAPALIQLIGIIPYVIKPFSEKREIASLIISNLDNMKEVKANFLFSVNFAFSLRTGLFMGYVIYCAFLVWQFKPGKDQKNNIPQEQYRVTYRWLVIFLTTLVFMVSNFSVITFEFINHNAVEALSKYSFLYNLTGAIFGCMALLLIFFPQVLYGIPRYNPSKAMIDNAYEEEIKSKISAYFTPEKNISQDEYEPFKALGNRILHHFEQEKPFTNPQFSLNDLATSLDVPLNHITYCLNNVLNIKFTALRMKYRVDHAKMLLSEGQHTVYTIENIAKISGFANRSSFYNAFKAETGMTPSEFLGVNSLQ